MSNGPENYFEFQVDAGGYTVSLTEFGRDYILAGNNLNPGDLVNAYVERTGRALIVDTLVEKGLCMASIVQDPANSAVIRNGNLDPDMLIVPGKIRSDVCLNGIEGQVNQDVQIQAAIAVAYAEQQQKSEKQGFDAGLLWGGSVVAGALFLILLARRGHEGIKALLAGHLIDYSEKPIGQPDLLYLSKVEEVSKLLHPREVPGFPNRFLHFDRAGARIVIIEGDDPNSVISTIATIDPKIIDQILDPMGPPPLIEDLVAYEAARQKFLKDNPGGKIEPHKDGTVTGLTKDRKVVFIGRQPRQLPHPQARG